MGISGLLLYYFHTSVYNICSAEYREGLQGKDTRSRWGVVFTAFVLTLIYLPMSTMAVHAIVWSDDFWPGNATTVSPSDDAVCYTTTLNEDEINFAPLVIVLAALTFIFVRNFSVFP